MNKKVIKILEYDKIIYLLKNQAGSEMTKKVISELQPFMDIRQINDALAETSEAVTVNIAKGSLPLGNFYDISKEIAYTKKGGSLTMKQLLRVAYNMRIARNIKTFLNSDLPPLPIFESMAEVLVVLKDLEETIDFSIISEDEMADNASPELKKIRREIVRKNEGIKTKINQIVNRLENKTKLQDSIVTMRDGRYVIPVKTEHKGSFPGIVHDQSSTGATVFIEPQVIVTLNNELRELDIQEKVEIEKILAELSSRVGEHYYDLRNNQDLLLQFDLINAKGRLAMLQKAECPTINNSGIINLKEVRHPLIDPKSVVPINVVLGETFRNLIITGPNTGGKTVTLKTVGLLSMMAMTGLHIPASCMSTLPVFEEIFADIGDEQSIEQSLSTFSSHMTNIVEISKNANEKTLILLDELGAGTDPTEGAALAIAILEELYSKKANVIATTHYTELKKYAITTEGVSNASMEFDVATLSPTYKLTIGIPGKSNAFEISRKLGLSGEIIDKAKMLLDGGDLAFEDVIEKIDADKKAAEAQRDEAIMLNIEMKKQKEQLEKDIRVTKAKNEKLINDAKEEARYIIEDAKKVTKEVQAELRELSKVESLGERNKRLDQSRRKVKDAAGRYREKFIVEENDAPVNVDEIEIGNRVKIMTINQNGVVSALPDKKGEIQVQVGAMKIKCKPKDLKLIIDGKKKLKPQKSKKKTTFNNNKAMNISTTLNVQGLNLDEAEDVVDKYLDDAQIANLPEVTIIHGRGTGVLKKGITKMLKNHRCVAERRFGTYNEGGDGVTIVKLK